MLGIIPGINAICTISLGKPYVLKCRVRETSNINFLGITIFDI